MLSQNPYWPSVSTAQAAQGAGRVFLHKTICLEVRCHLGVKTSQKRSQATQSVRVFFFVLETSLGKDGKEGTLLLRCTQLLARRDNCACPYQWTSLMWCVCVRVSHTCGRMNTHGMCANSTGRDIPFDQLQSWMKSVLNSISERLAAGLSLPLLTWSQASPLTWGSLTLLIRKWRLWDWSQWG